MSSGDNQQDFQRHQKVRVFCGGARRTSTKATERMMPFNSAITTTRILKIIYEFIVTSEKFFTPLLQLLRVYSQQTQNAAAVARPYSTVTDLARLRGLSTSVPFCSAA
jgi:hypothetical protein